MFYFFNSINHKKDNAQEKLDFKYCNFWRRFVSNNVVGSRVPNLQSGFVFCKHIFKMLKHVKCIDKINSFKRSNKQDERVRQIIITNSERQVIYLEEI